MMKTSKRLLASCLCLVLASLPVLTGIAEKAPPPSIPPSPGPIAHNFERVEQTLYLYVKGRFLRIPLFTGCRSARAPQAGGSTPNP